MLALRVAISVHVVSTRLFPWGLDVCIQIQARLEEETWNFSAGGNAETGNWNDITRVKKPRSSYMAG